MFWENNFKHEIYFSTQPTHYNLCNKPDPNFGTGQEKFFLKLLLFKKLYVYL